MKKIVLAICVLITANAFATIEYSANESKPVSSQEIQKNRSCFEELAKQGCADPGEDIKAFRSCLSSAFPSLTPECQSMMSKLYK